MNETKPQSAIDSYKWHINARKNDQTSHDLIAKPLIELTASFNAAAAYHPLKTIGVQLLCGAKVNKSFSALYRGFIPGLLGAHQLFLMGVFQHIIKGQYSSCKKQLDVVDQLAAGALAGALTTVTITPLELISTLKQSQKALPDKSIKTLYRGFAPMFLRQTGLGTGLFYLPQFFSEKFKEKYPEQAEKHGRISKICCSIAGGSIAAAATQLFEISKTLMQNDAGRKKYVTFKDAFKESFVVMKTPKGAQLFGTAVKHTCRDFRNHKFNQRYLQPFDRKRRTLMKQMTMPYVYFQGSIKPVNEASISLACNSLQYGTTCFAGIRGYVRNGSIDIFRLYDHYERLMNAAKIMGFNYHTTYEHFYTVISELVAKNQPASNFYIRAFLLAPDEQLAPKPKGLNFDLAIYFVPLGNYFEQDKGMRVMISSWRKFPDSSFPTKAKAGGCYINSFLATAEANRCGYDEALMMDQEGYIVEASVCKPAHGLP